ncbi:NAD(P)/FAD-dependent oxidoreductase [Marinobacter changyiensis]|uniref:NAD(P)/FAD-dependent oxidoreductase n=1 Tax=Marinobacter changyiensis TaxID=2604091 RepID=UPI001FEC9CF7|nr:NAD(P)/FAD-dependent oxidoreductase [Marinobacter changyiensis]
MNSSELTTDVLIIGAGPAGAVAAGLLRKKGWRVLVLEKQHFPRFSIGESLLPQCMAFVAEAGMTEAVEAGGFQYKNGAAFHHAGRDTAFDFREKFSAGPGTTFQVERGQFDHILATEAEKAGVDVRFGHEILAVDFESDVPLVEVGTDKGDAYQVSARFVLDASGFGRVLPRLLELETPSSFPVRMALFTHVADRIDAADYDRDKILITVHPEHRDVWYWLIPFGNGRSSLGVVVRPEFMGRYQGDAGERLKQVVDEDPNLARLLANAQWDTPVREIRGYSANVKQLWGRHFALLGNAAEFLDPVFSSGVTIAMKSASLAAESLDRQLRGESVDWDASFAEPLKKGVDTFRTYVDGWYDGSFQDVIFAENPSVPVREMVSSILAGYAWDTANPYVSESRRRLRVLTELCRE